MKIGPAVANRLPLCLVPMRPAARRPLRRRPTRPGRQCLPLTCAGRLQVDVGRPGLLPSLRVRVPPPRCRRGLRPAVPRKTHTGVADRLPPRAPLAIVYNSRAARPVGLPVVRRPARRGLRRHNALARRQCLPRPAGLPLAHTRAVGRGSLLRVRPRRTLHVADTAAARRLDRRVGPRAVTGTRRAGRGPRRPDALQLPDNDLVGAAPPVLTAAGRTVAPHVDTVFANGLARESSLHTGTGNNNAIPPVGRPIASRPRPLLVGRRPDTSTGNANIAHPARLVRRAGR